MRRYLIVDDNRAYAENLAEILQNAGDEVEVAASGLEAIAMARATRFHAVVTDMQMPQMSGGSLLQELRRLDPGLSVLVVTAYTRHAEIERAQRDGLLAILPKPTPVERLSRLLQRARHGGLLALVQDDPAPREGFRQALEDAGFTTVFVGSPGELAGLGALTPFAGVVDLQADGEPDGAAVRILRERFPGLPVILATPRDAVMRPGISLRCLTRPIDPAQLLGAVEQIYESARRPGRTHAPSDD
jgi:two-component system, response regulator PdtaR